MARCLWLCSCWGCRSIRLRYYSATVLASARRRLRVQANPRTHAGTDTHCTDVRALGRAGPRPDNRVDQDAQVLNQRLATHRHTTGHDVQVGQAVHAKLHATGLQLVHDPAHVVGHGSGARVRHQTSRTQNPTQRSDDAHVVRRGHGGVEVQPATADSLGQLVGADLIRARVTRFLRPVAAGEHDDALLLAGAIRQRHGTAHLLVRVGGINAQVGVKLHGLIELRRRQTQQHVYSVAQRVLSRAVHARPSLPIPPTMSRHAYSSTSMPMLRAVPATIFIAASTS